MPIGIDPENFYASTDNKSCIDWCMTNNTNKDEHNVTVYESWYSDHKPLWLEIGDPVNFK